MKVSKITFYQSVVIGKSGFNTVYEDMPETKGVEIEYLREDALIKITGSVKGVALGATVYVGLANVRCFHVNDEVELTEAGQELESMSGVFTTGERHETPAQTLANKPVENMTEEDEKIILTQAIKNAGGKTPHPMTGTKKLKETLKKLEKEGEK